MSGELFSGIQTGLLFNKPVFFLGLLSVGLAFSSWIPLPVSALVVGALFRYGLPAVFVPDLSLFFAAYCLYVGALVAGQPINLIRTKLGRFFSWIIGLLILLSIGVGLFVYFTQTISTEQIRMGVLIVLGMGGMSWPAFQRIIQRHQAQGPLTVTTQSVMVYSLLITVIVGIVYVLSKYPIIELFKIIPMSFLGAVVTIGSVLLATRRAQKSFIAVVILIGMLWSWTMLVPEGIYVTALLVGLGLRWVPEVREALAITEGLTVLEAIALFVLILLFSGDVRLVGIGAGFVLVQYVLGLLVGFVFGRWSGFVESVYPRIGGMFWQQQAVSIFLIQCFFTEYVSTLASIWVGMIVTQMIFHPILVSRFLRKAGEIN